MKFPLKAVLAATTLLVAQPAWGAVISPNPDGTYTVANVGDEFTIDFNGFVDQGNTVIDGLTSSLTLTLTGISGTDWMFSYSLENTSSSPITGSAVTAFGFDVDPDAVLMDSSVTGFFDTIAEGQISQGAGFDVEICAKNGQDNNCAGSPGNQGVNMGNTGTGTLTLGLSSDVDSILLGDFVVRYQAITGPEGTPGSAIGTPENPPPVVPEPGTWAMMLMGLGAAGYALRRRRNAVLPQLA